MFERQKVINSSNGITADRAALFLRGPGWLSAFAKRGGPMVCEHLQRGRQEIKIFLKTLLQDLPSMISSRTQASCLPGFLFYGATLTLAPSPPTEPVELQCVSQFRLQLWIRVNFLKGLHNFSFIPAMGKAHLLPRQQGRGAALIFPFAFPEGSSSLKSAGAVRAVIQAELSLLGVVVHQVENGQRNGLQSRNLLEKQSVR